MKKIQLPIRMTETVTFSDEEALSRRAIGIEDEDVYIMGYLTIDLHDIENWHEEDIQTTRIRTYTDRSYVVFIPYEEFNALWTQLTGEAVVSIRFNEKKPRKSKNSLK